MNRAQKLQTTLSQVIRSEDYSSNQVLMDEIIPPTKMTSAQSIEVYSGNYFDGITIHLSNIFPHVKAIIGYAGLDKIGKDFIKQTKVFPSDLRWFGEGFPQFLRLQFLEEHEYWIADLATLDWFWHEQAFIDSKLEENSSFEEVQADPSFRKFTSHFSMLELINAIDNKAMTPELAIASEEKHMFFTWKVEGKSFLHKKAL